MSKAVDNELEQMRQKVKEMEEEAAKLREMQAQVEKEMTTTDSTADKEAVDNRSIYVGNVDYIVTPDDLQNHFQSCGVINRITIVCDKYTGHPKGFAYVEFNEEASVANSLALNESLLRGRLIKVTAKRTNLPAFMLRGGGRGGGRGGYGGYARGGGGRPPYRPRGGRSRRAHYSPY